MTSNPGAEHTPVWSHDGRYIAYAAERDGSTQIYRLDANGGGQEQRLTDGPNAKVPWDWSRDGRYLLYTEQAPQTLRDIWILPLDGPGGAPGKPIPFLTSPDNEVEPRLSPDGKWIAFVSNATGNARAYIRAFPGGPQGQWPVSVGAATNLSWHTSGNELYYRGPGPSGSGGVFAATFMALQDRVEIGAAQELYESVLGGTGGALSSDGQRFLAFSRPGEVTEQSRSRNPLTAVINWQAALE